MNTRLFDENRSWKQRELDYMEFMYGEEIKKYEGHKDDRQIYINIYNIIIEALNTLPEEPVTFIKVAMNHHIDEDKKVLDSIKEEFKNK